MNFVVIENLKLSLNHRELREAADSDIWSLGVKIGTSLTDLLKHVFTL